MEVPNTEEALREQIVPVGSLIRIVIPLNTFDAVLEFPVTEEASLQKSIEYFIADAAGGRVKEVPLQLWVLINRAYIYETLSTDIITAITDKIFRKPSNIVITNAGNDLDMFASFLESSAGEWDQEFTNLDQLLGATEIIFMKFRGTYGCSNFLFRYRDVVQALCDPEIRHELNISPLIEETTLADVAKVCRAFVKDYELAPVAELTEV